MNFILLFLYVPAHVSLCQKWGRPDVGKIIETNFTSL